MYFPIQIPYVLDPEFRHHISYSEEISQLHQEFVICFWEMISSSEAFSSHNIIIPDGCIDLIVNYQQKSIGFSGMSKTVFDATVPPCCHWLGARLKPGAFFALTGFPATAAMDHFLPLTEFDPRFDTRSFFTYPPAEGKQVFKDYLAALITNRRITPGIALFDQLYLENTPVNIQQICQKLHLGPRQCQRFFKKHYGLSPKAVLSLIRFQKQLNILVKEDTFSSHSYYDQSHYIKDFKKNLGITPLELVNSVRR